MPTNTSEAIKDLVGWSLFCDFAPHPAPRRPQEGLRRRGRAFGKEDEKGAARGRPAERKRCARAPDGARETTSAPPLEARPGACHRVPPS